MSKKAEQKDQQELHAVLLLKDHKHAGKTCLAGATINVTTTDRNWLLAQHVIAPVANSAAE